MRRYARVGIVGLTLAASAANANAAAEGPVNVTKANVEQFKSLLPEPVYTRTKAGQYTFTIVPVDPQRFRANYSDRFWAASEANAGKFGIDPDTGGLTDVATGQMAQHAYGLPFPIIDQNDPQAGTKIMHNFRLRKTQVDGTIHYFDLVDVDQEGNINTNARIFVSEKYYFGTSSPPPATLPDNTEWRQLGAAVAPKDAEGVGVLTWRFHDWKTWDQVWAYLPNIRRVRRVRSSQRGDRIPGFEVRPDDADCYDNKVTYFTWTLAGSGEVIGPVGSDTPYAYTLKSESPSRWSMEVPYNNAVYETPGVKGAPWMTLKNVYIRRPVWIVEGKPKDPYYEAGKVQMFIDKDLYHAYYKLAYSPAGELYQTTFCGSAWGRTPDGSFAAPSSLLVLGVNERENRGTPTGRYTKETFERAFEDKWFEPAHLSKLSE